MCTQNYVICDHVSYSFGEAGEFCEVGEEQEKRKSSRRHSSKEGGEEEAGTQKRKKKKSKSVGKSVQHEGEEGAMVGERAPGNGQEEENTVTMIGGGTEEDVSVTTMGDKATYSLNAEVDDHGDTAQLIQTEKKTKRKTVPKRR